jgi:hypothetical protein
MQPVRKPVIVIASHPAIYVILLRGMHRSLLDSERDTAPQLPVSS